MSASRPAPSDLRRRVPAVEKVLGRPRIRALEQRFGRPPVLDAVRAVLQSARAAAQGGDGPAVDALMADLTRLVEVRLTGQLAPSLVPVINATGVVIHTNLGRAPLSAAAASRVAEIASSYSNLEYDLETGQRGRRETHVEPRLRSLLGAEAALVVNNNAAAVLLAVNTFAEGRSVLVSRGELVEIGESFRIPDVVGKGGARLVEVGTTNRTRVADFRAALGPEVGLILRVHPSNFRIVGFTENPAREELVALGREAQVPVVEDLGSGLLTRLAGPLRGEETVADALAAGVDAVTFSGDKLLGGPQAGLAAGRGDAIRLLRRNALYRALRVDKMTIAALEVLLREYQAGRAAAEVPVQHMVAASASEVRARSMAFAAALTRLAPSLHVSVAHDASLAGGGAAPATNLPTSVVLVTHPSRSPDDLARALRTGPSPVVVRVSDGVLVDLRTVFPRDEQALLAALAALDQPGR